jgi:uncharacterized repeat protein (TIGR01451 family)
MVFALAGLVGGLVGAGSASALPAGCSQSLLTVTCSYTSAGANAFVVPDGVGTVHVIAVGGKGADSGQNTTDALGGFGARVTGDLSVFSGETLWAVVGGNGEIGFEGANGGGGATSGFPESGSGGGASDVRLSRSDLSTRVLVAGGGGGGGRAPGIGGAAYPFQGGNGGDAGHDGGPGGDLTHTDNNNFSASGGSGGTAGGAGAGGSGGAAGSASGGTSPTTGCAGNDGTLGQGGDGGIPSTPPAPFCEAGGGGGGGGLYGGGGGGAGGMDAFGFDTAGSGGGGGGSSLVPAGGTLSIDSTAVPEIVISYTIPDAVSPSSLDFGLQAIGSTSAAKTVTFSNNGSGSIGISSAAITSGGSDFAISSDGCSGTSVGGSSSCAVQVTFGPTATGPRAGTLTFTDDASDSPQTVSLSGTGTTLADVGVAISGPTSAASGSQQAYAITVSNAGPSTALGVVMSAQVPAGTKFVAVSTTKGSCSHPAAGATTGTITCSLGDLASGASAINGLTLKIVLTAKGGSILLTASANSPTTPDPNPANNASSLNTTVTKK